MAVAPQPRGYLERPRPSGLADVIEIILDKGIVIDAYVRVSLIGIEILTIDARIVIASVDTYLRFAEAVNRLDIAADRRLAGPARAAWRAMTEGGAKSKTKGALEGAKEKLGGGDDDDDDGDSDDKDAESKAQPHDALRFVGVRGRGRGSVGAARDDHT